MHATFPIKTQDRAWTGRSPQLHTPPTPPQAPLPRHPSHPQPKSADSHLAQAVKLCNRVRGVVLALLFPSPFLAVGQSFRNMPVDGSSFPTRRASSLDPGNVVQADFSATR